MPSASSVTEAAPGCEADLRLTHHGGDSALPLNQSLADMRTIMLPLNHSLADVRAVPLPLIGLTRDTRGGAAGAEAARSSLPRVVFDSGEGEGAWTVDVEDVIFVKSTYRIFTNDSDDEAVEVEEHNLFCDDFSPPTDAVYIVRVPGENDVQDVQVHRGETSLGKFSSSASAKTALTRLGLRIEPPQKWDPWFLNKWNVKRDSDQSQIKYVCCGRRKKVQEKDTRGSAAQRNTFQKSRLSCRAVTKLRKSGDGCVEIVICGRHCHKASCIRAWSTNMCERAGAPATTLTDVQVDALVLMHGLGIKRPAKLTRHLERISDTGTGGKIAAHVVANEIRKRGFREEVSRAEKGWLDMSPLMDAAENRGFYREVNRDESGRATSVMFMNYLMAHLLQSFGPETLQLDATYKKFNRRNPVINFIVIDNHFNTRLVMFGLTFRETEEDYKFFFEAMLNLQHRHFQLKEHQVQADDFKLITIDQGSGILPACRKIFPNAQFQFCRWHLTQAASTTVSIHAGNEEAKKWVELINRFAWSKSPEDNDALLTELNAMKHDLKKRYSEDKGRRSAGNGTQGNNGGRVEHAVRVDKSGTMKLWEYLFGVNGDGGLFGRREMWFAMHVDAKFTNGVAATQRVEGQHSTVVKAGDLDGRSSEVDLVDAMLQTVQNQMSAAIMADNKTFRRAKLLAKNVFDVALYNGLTFEAFNHVQQRANRMKLHDVVQIELLDGGGAVVTLQRKTDDVAKSAFPVEYGATPPREDAATAKVTLTVEGKIECNCFDFTRYALPCTHALKSTDRLHGDKLLTDITPATFGVHNKWLQPLGGPTDARVATRAARAQPGSSSGTGGIAWTGTAADARDGTTLLIEDVQGTVRNFLSDRNTQRTPTNMQRVARYVQSMTDDTCYTNMMQEPPTRGHGNKKPAVLATQLYKHMFGGGEKRGADSETDSQNGCKRNKNSGA